MQVPYGKAVASRLRLPAGGQADLRAWRQGRDASVGSPFLSSGEALRPDSQKAPGPPPRASQGRSAAEEVPGGERFLTPPGPSATICVQSDNQGMKMSNADAMRRYGRGTAACGRDPGTNADGGRRYGNCVLMDMAGTALGSGILWRLHVE
jgi:hypothetical protein